MSIKSLKLKNERIFLLALAILFIAMPACDLTEPTYSEFTPDTFYDNETAVLTSLSGIYRDFALIPTSNEGYRVLELVADQVIILGKIQGWWDDYSYHNLTWHEWNASNRRIEDMWNRMFTTVGQANALISSLENSNLEEPGPIAELKAMRAYAYFFLMDLYGNVPVFTEPKVDPNNLPKQNTRAEVFDFVVEELKAAAKILPSANDVGNEYYGRITKEAVYGILAIAYLNAEVFTGTPRYEMAINYADSVIESNAFRLLDDYNANFAHDNANNDEMIFAAVYAPNDPGGIGQTFVQKVMPGISGGLFGLPYTPQNGYSVRSSVVDLYEDQDVRKDIFMTTGPLLDPRNGDTVYVERVVPDGNSVLYVPGESTEGPVPYDVIKPTELRNQPMNAGVNWIKWRLDPNTNGGNASNDIAWIRYADILLIKAEAQLRLGTGDPLSLVNRVRERSNATPLDNLTLNDILDERGRELVFEMSRRRDLIRFDKFNEPWEFKEQSEESRKLFPIPASAIESNPNLKPNSFFN
ncbi:MAG: RagB/SusD family nutrient uptake outer membrane protein [Balneolaceae bacterium]